VRIAVVIPCHRVSAHVVDVLARVGGEVARIYVVDDACPEGSGDAVERGCRDPRVVVLRNAENLGVGGAMMRGYRQAIEDGMDVIVKLDGDGQMDPAFVPALVSPLLTGEADYAKGNRFFDLAHIYRMPPARIAGNAVLSFMTKLSTGYWDVFDPTNGFTAIRADSARRLPMDRISQRYFFESDMLFRLGTLRAVVVDVPMEPVYGAETSGLSIPRIVPEFLFKHARNFLKRIFYNYFLRDMSLASFELVAGVPLLAFGIVFGIWNWAQSAGLGQPTPAGTVMLAALPIIVGLNFVLAFLAYDIANVPRRRFASRPGFDRRGEA
jgi:dolichol-phosphate mannosyltransferase